MLLATWCAALPAQTSPEAKKPVEASGGEQLTSREVAALPLNKRDFSQLLLLAAGTMTDTNGTANFTQQFAVNGQRGSATVFALDGIDATDPEMGGATFSNFNVDAIEEIRSLNGVMPAEIGHGAAGFTDIVTKSGVNRIHGSLFEFVRNAAFDARNFFDRRSETDPRRIPPFVRNEFGITLGGPVVLPGIYNGRNRTYYFGQYQGFRQVLSSTQVIPVPTPEERRGVNTSAFPGDALYVPVNPAISEVLECYPAPNDPQGAFGARTYASSTRVTTFTDQFSIRMDHQIAPRARLFGRFSLNNVSGPLTNPSQTVIDRSFATEFLDRQRNAGVRYTRSVTPRLILETTLGFLRSTPSFPTFNRTQPAIKFADGLYEGFNTAGGNLTTVFGNLFQARQSGSYVRGNHTLKWGLEVRVNRDTTFFSMAPNGEYTFGGGAAYSPVAIRSRSGAHDIAPGDPLPDALTGLLTATPFAYSVSVAPDLFGLGEHMGDVAIRREAYNAYMQDAWKASARLSVSYGLRFEVNTPFREAAGKTSGLVPGPAGAQRYLINLQPPFRADWSGWGPRLALDLRLDERTAFRAGGSIMTLLPNIYQQNFVMGGVPFVNRVQGTAQPGSPIRFENVARSFAPPPVYARDGGLVFAERDSKRVAPNTEMDVDRFLRDLARLTPGNQIRPFTPYGVAPGLDNGYIATWTANLERRFGDFNWSASYVATAGVHLGNMFFPNSYIGAQPEFAPYTRFDPEGRIVGGFGAEYLINSGSHSTYHALQAALAKNSLRQGLGLQVSYTFGKSIDDTSGILPGFLSGASGTVLQTSPQNPWNTRAERGVSTFDVTHVLTFSVLKELVLERTPGFRALPRALASGWQVLNISTLTSGSPFTIYSGIQQTGAGVNGADRPDQTGYPELSTRRTVREDYLGWGAANTRFFSIPVGVPGGTGPNRGRFGSLGRNTFRGPALHNFDVALIKDTRVARRAGGEPVAIEFRAEFFNVFNVVNFGLPSNIVLGPGFGMISKTAGTSRQIQFSLKLLY